MTSPDLDAINNLELKRYTELLLYIDSEDDEEHQERYLLKEKIEKALEHVGVCSALVLTGEDAIKFEKYNKRKPSKKELEFTKEADRIYALHDKEPKGTLKAYMKMWEDVVNERNKLLQNQRTEQDKQNEEMVKEIRNPNFLNYLVGRIMSFTKGQVSPDDVMRVIKQELQSIIGDKK